MFPEQTVRYLSISSERAVAAEADRPQPNFYIAETYRTKIARLAETLTDPDARLEAAEHIRSLVGRAMLTPGARHGEVDIALIPDSEAVTRKEEG